MGENGDDAGMDGEAIHDEEMASLAAAYAAAHYFVTVGHREWLFGVGQLAADIERELGAEHYLFITAWNPPASTLTHAQNLAADEQLHALIRESGLQHCSALGSNAQGGAVEYGWVVLDIPLETADAWASKFGQAGTLYWKRDEPVRLRMLRPRPRAAADDPHIDWAG
ncbi:MAG: DUF3293 domain-containing protein [Pseudoxanthomonas sp.]